MDKNIDYIDMEDLRFSQTYFNLEYKGKTYGPRDEEYKEFIGLA